MDLIDQIRNLASKIENQLENIKTEEATKHAFVLPFINMLGYDVFDPNEVVPEYIADVVTKKGEKVDYAILSDNKPVIIIECKSAGRKLSVQQKSQLYRYFTATPVRIGILTDGIQYRFYSDIDRPNLMDDHPFLEFSILNISDADIVQIKKFTKSEFVVEEIVSAAARLKSINEVQEIFARELREPSEDFVKFFANAIDPNQRFTKTFKQEYTPLVQKALNAFISKRVEGRLTTARNLENSAPDSNAAIVETALADPPKIETISEELDGYYLIKSILRDLVESTRITMRDTQSYCGILLDDNNRKRICRLYFNNTNNMRIGIMNLDKIESKHEISKLDDIYDLSESLRQVVSDLIADEKPKEELTK